MNKISSFYIGADNASGMTFDNEMDFIEAIREEIRKAEANNQEHFDITIEETEC